MTSEYSTVQVTRQQLLLIAITVASQLAGLAEQIVHLYKISSSAGAGQEQLERHTCNCMQHGHTKDGPIFDSRQPHTEQRCLSAQGACRV